jgi:hypothetical protein
MVGGGDDLCRREMAGRVRGEDIYGWKWIGKTGIGNNGIGNKWQSKG